MKNKIKEALRQEYKSRLELHDEQLEGVAAFAATFVTDDAKIEEFVKNDATFSMLKSYQSILDKDRAKRKSEGENGQQGSENGNNQSQEQQQQSQQGQGGGNQQTETVPAWAQAIIDSNKALSDELASFKGEQSAKAALAAAESKYRSNDYVKKYTDEGIDAWERATEMYEATGKKWTAEELTEKAMGYFNKAVGKKGVDTTQPFKSDGGGGDNNQSRFEAMAKRQQERQGAIAGE